MLRCQRAGELNRAVDVEILKFEINLIYLRQSVRSEAMNTANCRETSLSALDYYQQQVSFNHMFFSFLITITGNICSTDFLRKAPKLQDCTISKLSKRRSI